MSAPNTDTAGTPNRKKRASPQNDLGHIVGDSDDKTGSTFVPKKSRLSLAAATASTATPPIKHLTILLCKLAFFSRPDNPTTSSQSPAPSPSPSEPASGDTGASDWLIVPHPTARTFRDKVVEPILEFLQDKLDLVLVDEPYLAKVLQVETRATPRMVLLRLFPDAEELLRATGKDMAHVPRTLREATVAFWDQKVRAQIVAGMEAWATGKPIKIDGYKLNVIAETVPGRVAGEAKLRLRWADEKAPTIVMLGAQDAAAQVARGEPHTSTTPTDMDTTIAGMEASPTGTTDAAPTGTYATHSGTGATPSGTDATPSGLNTATPAITRTSATPTGMYATSKGTGATPMSTGATPTGTDAALAGMDATPTGTDAALAATDSAVTATPPSEAEAMRPSGPAAFPLDELDLLLQSADALLHDHETELDFGQVERPVAPAPALVNSMLDLGFLFGASGTASATPPSPASQHVLDIILGVGHAGTTAGAASSTPVDPAASVQIQSTSARSQPEIPDCFAFLRPADVPTCHGPTTTPGPPAPSATPATPELPVTLATVSHHAAPEPEPESPPAVSDAATVHVDLDDLNDVDLNDLDDVNFDDLDDIDLDGLDAMAHASNSVGSVNAANNVANLDNGSNAYCDTEADEHDDDMMPDAYWIDVDESIASFRTGYCAQSHVPMSLVYNAKWDGAVVTPSSLLLPPSASSGSLVGRARSCCLFALGSVFARVDQEYVDRAWWINKAEEFALAQDWVNARSCRRMAGERVSAEWLCMVQMSAIGFGAACAAQPWFAADVWVAAKERVADAVAAGPSDDEGDKDDESDEDEVGEAMLRSVRLDVARIVVQVQLGRTVQREAVDWVFGWRADGTRFWVEPTDTGEQLATRFARALDEGQYHQQAQQHDEHVSSELGWDRGGRGTDRGGA